MQWYANPNNIVFITCPLTDEEIDPEKVNCVAYQKHFLIFYRNHVEDIFHYAF